MLVDIRQQKVLPKWKSAVIICDVQAGDGLMEAVLEGFDSHRDGNQFTLAIYSIDSRSRLSSL